MSGELEEAMTGWTVPLKEHVEALQKAEAKFQAERDRRYSEVNIEKEKALKIKETADLAALGLAREIQTYKDEKANQLREQITAERGTYATKDDIRAVEEKFTLALKPLVDYVITAQGRAAGIGLSGNVLATCLTIILAAVAIAIAFH